MMHQRRWADGRQQSLAGWRSAEVRGYSRPALLSSPQEEEAEIPKEFKYTQMPVSSLMRMMSHGVQMVEYPPFGPILDRSIANAWFHINGRAGYLLKPWSVRLPSYANHPHHVHFPEYSRFFKPRTAAEDDKLEEENHEAKEQARVDDRWFPSIERCGTCTFMVKVISGLNLGPLGTSAGKAKTPFGSRKKVRGGGLYCPGSVHVPCADLQRVSGQSDRVDLGRPGHTLRAFSTGHWVFWVEPEPGSSDGI